MNQILDRIEEETIEIEDSLIGTQEVLIRKKNVEKRGIVLHKKIKPYKNYKKSRRKKRTKANDSKSNRL